MGDITQALRTAQSGLLVNQQALNTVSNNISNVNTPGYSKKVITFENVAVAGVPAGVKISSVSRKIDEGLLKSLRIEFGELATLTEKTEYYARMQELFGSPGDNTSLSHTLEELGEAAELLAVSPDKALEAAEFVRRAVDVTNQLQSMSETIQELRLQADNAISDEISEINTITAQIDQLNDDIISNGTVGRDVTDLQDQRDLQIDKLAEIVDIRYFFRSDGDAVVFTTAGRTLVDTVPPTLSHTAASSITPTTTHAEGDITGIYVGTAVESNDMTDEVREGKLKALIELRDELLPNLQSQIDEFAAELRDAVNLVHNRGAPFPGSQTMSGERIFIASTTQTMTLDSTSGADDVTITLFDSSGDQHKTTTLETIMTSSMYGSGVQAANGPWTISEVAATVEDWLQENASSSATASIDTSGKLQINLNTTTYNLAFRDETATANGNTAEDASISFDSNGDGNNDETISGFSNFFGLNDFFVDTVADNVHESDVLASSFETTAATLTFRDGSTGLLGSLPVTTGTSLTDLATNITNNITDVTASVIPDGSGVRLRISHDNGSSMTVTQAASETLLTTMGVHRADVGISQVLSVRSDIQNTPALISTGRPQWDSSRGASGEYFMSTGDDTIAQQMTSVFTTENAFDQAGGLASVSLKFANYAAEILANNASLADVNDRTIESQRALTESLQFKSDSNRGVNLDEEMADLIVFEQAFAAAARVMSVIQNMIQALERAVS